MKFLRNDPTLRSLGLKLNDTLHTNNTEGKRAAPKPTHENVLFCQEYTFLCNLVRGEGRVKKPERREGYVCEGSEHPVSAWQD
jgi:hypothetical protein